MQIVERFDGSEREKKIKFIIFSVGWSLKAAVIRGFIFIFVSSRLTWEAFASFMLKNKWARVAADCVDSKFWFSFFLLDDFRESYQHFLFRIFRCCNFLGTEFIKSHRTSYQPYLCCLTRLLALLCRFLPHQNKIRTQYKFVDSQLKRMKRFSAVIFSCRWWRWWLPCVSRLSCSVAEWFFFRSIQLYFGWNHKNQHCKKKNDHNDFNCI